MHLRSAKIQEISLNEISIGSLLQNNSDDTMVITLKKKKIYVHSHKNYLVYKNLCKVCLIILNCRENVHMSHIFIMFFSSLGKIYIFQFL